MGTAGCATLPPVRSRIALLMTLALVVAGCGEDDPKGGPDLATQLARLKGSPPQLAALHRQASKLLDGGPDAFRAKIADLRGRPVVVNKWASWCAPCRGEFPVFQRVAMKQGKRVAFLGVDSNDNDANARKFLEKYPVSYPTFKDPTLKVSELFRATVAWPSTAFYDRKGKFAYVHQGPYVEDADLLEDIERYAR